MRLRWISMAAVVMALACALAGLQRWRVERQATLALGARASDGLCGACHLAVPPEALTRDEWRYALSYMAFFLGQELGRGDRGLDFHALHAGDAADVHALEQRRRFLDRAALVPDLPAVDDRTWLAIREHFLSRAPGRRPPQAAPPPEVAAGTWGLQPMSVMLPGVSLTSLVRIDPRRHTVLAGGLVTTGKEQRGRLFSVDASGVVTGRVDQAGAPCDVSFAGPRMWVTLIGDFFPSPILPRPSSLWDLPRDVSGAGEPVITGVPRSASMLPIDLDGGRRHGFLAAGFGFGTLREGGLLLYQPSPDGGYTEKTVWSQPGLMRLVKGDIDGDGQPEVLAAVAGPREGVFAFRGCEASGGCVMVPLLERPPSFGLTDLRVADMDGDGRLDLVVVNGDGLDVNIHNLPRPEQGVRVFSNRGGDRFEETFFFPVPGASQAAVADLDLDGRLDLAVVAAYPQTSPQRLRTFLVLRQEPGRGYRAVATPEMAEGPWITVDGGDLDGDGAPDLALGLLRRPLGADFLDAAAVTRLDEARRSSPDLLILRNTARDAAARR